MTFRWTLLVALCSTAILTSGCATSHTDKTVWEYRVVSAASTNKEQLFNQLGGEGWTLVATDPLKGYLFRRAKQ